MAWCFVLNLMRASTHPAAYPDVAVIQLEGRPALAANKYAGSTVWCRTGDHVHMISSVGEQRPRPVLLLSAQPANLLARLQRHARECRCDSR